MRDTEVLPIYIDTYQLVREIYQITHKFSKEYKYCLGEQINKDVLKLLYFIFQASHIIMRRVEYIEAFLAELDMVRVEFRLAHDMHVLSTKQLAHLSQFLDRIIKQATAWKKYQKSRDDREKKEDVIYSVLPEPDIITGSG